MFAIKNLVYALLFSLLCFGLFPRMAGGFRVNAAYLEVMYVFENVEFNALDILSRSDTALVFPPRPVLRRSQGYVWWVSDSAQLLRLQSLSALGLGDYATMIDAHHKLVDLDEATCLDWYHVSLAYHASSDVEQASFSLEHVFRNCIGNGRDISRKPRLLLLRDVLVSDLDVLGRIKLESGDREAAEDAFRRIVLQSEAELLGWYRLYQMKEVDPSGAEQYQILDHLRYFMLDERGSLSRSSIYIIPELVKKQVWGQDILQALQHYLLLRGFLDDAEYLADNLINAFPQAPEFLVYRGQVSLARGALAEALDKAQKALAMESDFAPAYLLRAMVFEEHADWNSAVEEYANYHELAPEDLRGVVFLQRAKEQADEESLQPANRDLLVQLSDEDIVAEILQIDRGSFFLESNRINNGGFEHGRSYPADWSRSRWVGGERQNGLFFLGVDRLAAFEGRQSLRFLALWIEDDPSKPVAKVGSWQGFAEWVPTDKQLWLNPRSIYLLSFYYVTDNSFKDTSIVVYLDGEIWINRQLPPTEGNWRKVGVLLWNETDSHVSFRVLFQSFGTNIAFDGVQLRQIVPVVTLLPERFSKQVIFR